jgi:2-methylisocitrate lyase-like PEP mutase family enzyme
MANLLRPSTDGPAALRHHLASGSPVVALGAYDALSARMAEQAGAQAVYMTGFGVAASRLGRPDVGLLGLSEMAESARAMAEAIDVPLIADADTGYGSAINVIRTVQTYEAAGVSAIQLEDQLFPKRCGHMEGKTLIPAAEMARKIEAAVTARRNDDLVIIARTDAVATDGYDEAVRRARLYAEAGADILFVEAPGDLEQIAAIPGDLPGVPLLFNWVEGGRTAPVTLKWLADSGFSVVILPITGLLAAASALRQAYQAIVGGSPQTPALDFGGFTDLIGLDEFRALDQRFAPDAG